MRWVSLSCVIVMAVFLCGGCPDLDLSLRFPAGDQYREATEIVLHDGRGSLTLSGYGGQWNESETAFEFSITIKGKTEGGFQDVSLYPEKCEAVVGGERLKVVHALQKKMEPPFDWRVVCVFSCQPCQPWQPPPAEPANRQIVADVSLDLSEVLRIRGEAVDIDTVYAFLPDVFYEWIDEHCSDTTAAG